MQGHGSSTVGTANVRAAFQDGNLSLDIAEVCVRWKHFAVDDYTDGPGLHLGDHSDVGRRRSRLAG